MTNPTNLQRLFLQPILSSCHFPDVHPGQASDVWLVETSEERAIVRTTRMSKQPADEFWWGCQHLFGIDPTDVFALKTINTTLSRASLIPVPRVMRTAELGGVPFVVLEVLPGEPVHRFTTLPLAAIHQLGRSIATIHQDVQTHCGNFRKTMSYPATSFHTRLADILPALAQQFHGHVPEIMAAVPHFVSQARTIVSPAQAVPILLDMDPTQFLSDGTTLTGLVDTELYAYGPAALELIVLEYLLDEQQANVFQEGYTDIQEFPNLATVRPLYRYLNRLLSVQGAVPFADWMNFPVRFDP
jgi:aminoglycoside phosphotransferase (APT) family kinase protein